MPNVARESKLIFKTKFSGLVSEFEKINEIASLAQGSQIDIQIENGRRIVVLVFESEIDLVAFKIKYGEKYD